MLRILWIEYVSNEKVSRKMETTRTFIIKVTVEICRRHNEERGHGKSNTYRTLKVTERAGAEIVSNLHNKFE